MSSELLGVVFASSPWLLGSIVVYLLAYQQNSWQISHHLLALGIGSYIGYMIIALISYILAELNLRIFSVWALVAVIALIILVNLIRRSSLSATSHGHRQTRERSNASNKKSHTMSLMSRLTLVALFLWLMAIFLFVTFEAVLRPAVAWDTLLYWSKFAFDVVSVNLSETASSQAPAWGYRHPPGVVLISGWSRTAALIAGSKFLLYLPWLAIYVGMILTCIGFALSSFQNALFALSVALLIAGTPLLEAQAVLGGYADSWMAAGLLSALTWPALMNQRENQTRIFILGFVLVMSLLFLKAASVTIVALILISAIFTFLTRTAHRPKLIIFLLALLFTVTTAAAYFLSAILVEKISAFDAIIDLMPKIGPYQASVSFQLETIVTALYNLIVAWVANLSFPLAGILAIFLLSRTKLIHDGIHASYLYIFLIFISVYHVGAQIFSSHLLEYGLPGNDTSLSRISSLWLVSLILLLCAEAGSRMKLET